MRRGTGRVLKQERQRKPNLVGPGSSKGIQPQRERLLQTIKRDFPKLLGDNKGVWIGNVEPESRMLRSLIARVPSSKMPDLVMYVASKNWLVLIEAVTSHGAIDSERRGELETLFSNSKAALVFVTAFLNRKVMAENWNDIAWGTAVWVAEAPTHLIHFNGDQLRRPLTQPT